MIVVSHWEPSFVFHHRQFGVAHLPYCSYHALEELALLGALLHPESAFHSGWPNGRYIFQCRWSESV